MSRVESRDSMRSVVALVRSADEQRARERAVARAFALGVRSFLVEVGSAPPPSFARVEAARVSLLLDAEALTARLDLARLRGALGVSRLDAVILRGGRAPVERLDALLAAEARGLFARLGAFGLDAEALEALARELTRRSDGALRLEVAHQPYGLLDRAFEAGVRQVARARSIDVFAHHAGIGEALATRGRRFQACVERELMPLARRHRVEPDALATAWTLSREGITGVCADVASERDEQPDVERALAAVACLEGRAPIDRGALERIGEAFEPWARAERSSWRSRVARRLGLRSR